VDLALQEAATSALDAGRPSAGMGPRARRIVAAVARRTRLQTLELLSGREAAGSQKTGVARSGGAKSALPRRGAGGRCPAYESARAHDAQTRDGPGSSRRRAARSGSYVVFLHGAMGRRQRHDRIGQTPGNTDAHCAFVSPHAAGAVRPGAERATWFPYLSGSQRACDRVNKRPRSRTLSRRGASPRQLPPTRRALVGLQPRHHDGAALWGEYDVRRRDLPSWHPDSCWSRPTQVQDEKLAAEIKSRTRYCAFMATETCFIRVQPCPLATPKPWGAGRADGRHISAAYGHGIDRMAGAMGGEFHRPPAISCTSDRTRRRHRKGPEPDDHRGCRASGPNRLGRPPSQSRMLFAVDLCQSPSIFSLRGPSGRWSYSLPPPLPAASSTR